jgi:hypothetical protein
MELLAQSDLDPRQLVSLFVLPESSALGSSGNYLMLLLQLLLVLLELPLAEIVLALFTLLLLVQPLEGASIILEVEVEPQ